MFATLRFDFAGISQLNPAPASLARLTKNVRKDLVGKVRAKDVEGRLHLWIHDGFGEGRSRRLGFSGLATQRLGQRPDQARIPLRRLNLNPNQPSRRRAATVLTGRLALGLPGHRFLSG